MTNTRSGAEQNKMKFILVVGLFAACLVGCAGQDADDTSSGEPSTGSGGELGSGGSAIGGSPGTGGASGSGGAPDTSSGGAATGGNAASGGSGTGGNSATGGAAAGGSGSGGDATSVGGSGGEPGAGGTGSGGAGTGGAGTGGAPSYQPCPESPCKILPFGDSITWGVGDEGNGGYRGPLFASVVAAGQKITFTGSHSNGPNTVSGQPFPRRNEGHSGWGISRTTPFSGNNAGITTRIPTPAFSMNSGGTPNIVLLHIGTNDQGSYTAAQMAGDLSGLLDKLITHAPDAYIVVAQIIPLGYGDNAVIKAYNQALPGIVQERANAGKHVALVDMFTGFNAATMLDPDRVHPNRNGYAFMAARWYEAIEGVLPE